MDLKLSGNDIYLNPSTYEFELIDGLDAIAQDCEVRLQFFLGEWYLDTRLGVPYYQEILGHKPTMQAVKGIFRDAILTTPGIQSVFELEIDFEGTTRTLSVSFKAETVEGSFEFDKELILLRGRRREE